MALEKGIEMVVRVKVRLKALKGRIGKVIESVALLDTGYITEKPEAMIPIEAARMLGLWPNFPGGTEAIIYDVGIRSTIKDCLELQIITKDKTLKPVKTTAVINETVYRNIREILLSDASISAHQIIIEDAKQGIWRFKGEEKLRKSEKPQYW